MKWSCYVFRIECAWCQIHEQKGIQKAIKQYLTYFCYITHLTCFYHNFVNIDNSQAYQLGFESFIFDPQLLKQMNIELFVMKCKLTISRTKQMNHVTRQVANKINVIIMPTSPQNERRSPAKSDISSCLTNLSPTAPHFPTRG
ncbi:Hypothetical_protein [Hexamita inflata]|uniref:Hypothetical_protein n=1 Tax=Hexamita inflata TaxID=28002 RepID=A0AA86PL88_9EUKA|nr:Hypothetical protein HINF_LOCUS27927 [Hexamita inflata]